MKILLCAGLCLIALSRPAFAQWSWLYPQPQGHTLNDIVFLDNQTAIAVGEYGTVLITHDTGQTWTVKFSVNGLTQTLQHIDRLDASSAVAVGDQGVILRTVDQGATWTGIQYGTLENLRDVSFADATHGIVVAGVPGSDPPVLRTSDGGLTWQDAPGAISSFFSVDMISASEAVAVGLDGTRYTHDGGATWSDPIQLPTPSALNAGDDVIQLTGFPDQMCVDFLDASNGAIATGGDGTQGRYARWYVTSDGGANWTQDYPFGAVFNGNTITPRELLYEAPGELLTAYEWACCVLSAYDPPPNGAVAVSPNGGATATYQFFSHEICGLARNNDGVVIAVGHDGILQKRDANGTYTTLGGAPQYTQRGAAGSSFVTPSTGIVMSSNDYMFEDGTSHFARTTNGGQTWTVSNVAGFECFDLVHLSANDVYAVGVFGSPGIVKHSADGGATWSQVWSSASTPGLKAIAAGSSTHAVAVGNGSNALVIDNGIVTMVAMGASASWTDVAFASPLVVVAVSASGIARRSLDGGLTWSPVSGPVPSFNALAFATPTTGFGVTFAGLYRTDDAGATWSTVFVSSGLEAITFADTQHGMAVGTQVITTDNGGTTWVSLDSPTGRRLTDVTLFVTGQAYVSGEQQILFKYGQAPVPTLFRSLEVAARQFGADLRWMVETDENLAGFTIRRTSGTANETVASDLAVASRSYRDEGLVPGKTYEYQLLAVDRNGSFTQSVPVKVTIPNAMADLLPNQPNPFNPVTTIRFVVPEKMRVTISVHDVTGRVVSTLLDDVREPGVHELTWNAEGMASGVYFARLRAGKTEVSRKMVLLK